MHLLHDPADDPDGDEVGGGGTRQRRERRAERQEEEPDDHEDGEDGRDFDPGEVLADDDALLVSRRYRSGDADQMIVGRRQVPPGVQLCVDCLCLR